MKTEAETVQLLDPKTVLISKLNTRQPKKADVTELMETIRLSGQITPAVARPHPTKPGHYELAAGARRKVACETLKILLKTVVRPLTDAELEDMILIDNLQRTDPDPMAEARLIEHRIASGIAPSEIAAKYGKSETWLKRRIKLTGLTAKARDAWCEGESFGHYTTEMMEYVGCLTPAQQDELAEDDCSCFSLQELIGDFARHGKKLEGVEWLHDPVSFIPGCGPGCATNDAESLFPDPENPCGTCLNGECFRKREGLVRDAKFAEVLDGKPITDFILLRTKGYSDTFIYQGKDYKCLPEWKTKEHYSILKKQGPETLLGLDIADHNNPKILHLKAKAAAKNATNTASAPTGKQASREDKLTGKRLAALNQHLDNKVTDAPAPQGHAMLRLVAAFGTTTNRSLNYQGSDQTAPWRSLDSTGAIPAFGYAEGEDTPENVLWNAIKPILRARLKFYTNGDLLKEFMQEEMKRQAELIGLDYHKNWLEICGEIPVPKSWGPGIDPVTLEAIKAKPTHSDINHAVETNAYQASQLKNYKAKEAAKTAVKKKAAKKKAA